MVNVIIDYGLGNLRSVQKSIENINQKVIISNDKKVIEKADRIILPGVGAFRDAIKLLKEDGLDQTIKAFAKSQKPILGICLGMQLLYQKSFEDGEFIGLGLIEGEIKKFVGNYKVPHIGWNNVTSIKNILTKDLPNPYVYFVHSYFAPVNYATESETTYVDTTFSASISHENIYATQFHPEKSGDVGKKILENFFKI